MRIIAFLSFVVMLSCSGKSDKPAAAPKPPEAVDPAGTPPGDPGAAMNPDGQRSVTGTDVKQNPKIRALTPTDAINCDSMCGQLAYCNQKIHQKGTSGAALATCVKGCTARRGEADKGRWEAMETCMKQHGGEDCAALRKCIDNAIGALQKSLHGMDAPAPEVPMPAAPGPEVIP